MRIASDTVAAVAGAANGIGRAVAVELARRNARIALRGRQDSFASDFGNTWQDQLAH